MVQLISGIPPKTNKHAKNMLPEYDGFQGIQPHSRSAWGSNPHRSHLGFLSEKDDGLRLAKSGSNILGEPPVI